MNDWYLRTYGGGEKCHRCKKTVYKAEDREAANKHWHKVCFSCKDCGKKLDSTTLNERKNEGEEEIYCKGGFYFNTYANVCSSTSSDQGQTEKKRYTFFNKNA